MPLYKRRTFSGVVLEQEIYHVAPNTRNIRDTGPKPPPDMTPEERRRYNDNQALRRLIRNVNTNFGPWSWYVTLTFFDQFLPQTFDEARPILNNYIRRLQYAAPDMVAVAVMGRGINTNRIHFHLIISGVTEDEISSRWTLGGVKRIEKLRAHNIYNGKDHGADYTGLATYLFKHWTPEQGRGKRWRQTRNMKRPDDSEKPAPVKRTYSEAHPPIVKLQGYRLVDFKQTKYGYMCFKYIYFPDDDSEPPPGGV